MKILQRVWILGLALIVSAQGLFAQGDTKVKFDTVDGVTIRGNLYISAKGEKAPTILMLHPLNNVKDKKPGDQMMDGWQELAKELHKAGYSVLTFDFRGHGDSTSVSQSFLRNNYPWNTTLVKIRRDIAALSSKDFRPGYQPHLVDDVAAAKTFLNSKGQVNSANLIVLGAGEGATIGALWMASETKRRQGDVQTTMATLLPTLPVPRDFFEPESRDMLAGILLSPVYNLGGKQMPIGNWVKDITAKRSKERTQLLFVYGGKDANMDKQIQGYLKSVRPGYTKKKDGTITVTKSILSSGLDNTVDLKLDSKDQGAALIPGGEVSGYLTKTWLPSLTANLTLREPDQKEGKNRYYYWVRENMGKVVPGSQIPAQMKDDDAQRPIPLQLFGIN